MLPCGGIGRHAGFRHSVERREGSSPFVESFFLRYIDFMVFKIILVKTKTMNFHISERFTSSGKDKNPDRY